MTPLRRILPPDPSACLCGKSDCDIPFGYCHCGCGERTKLARQRIRNLYAGFPLLYINGHNAIKRPVIECEPPFFLNGSACRWLQASKGYFAIVDADKYEELMQWRWFGHHQKACDKVYLMRHGGTKNGVRSPLVLLHRYLLSAPPDKTVDHINGNSLDNRLSNLRIATMRQQIQNRKKHRRGILPYKGVYLGAHKAGITHYGNHVHLGCYKTVENAAIAYDCAARILFGEFANLNFPERTVYPDWCAPIKEKCLRILLEKTQY